MTHTAGYWDPKCRIFSNKAKKMFGFSFLKMVLETWKVLNWGFLIIFLIFFNPFSTGKTEKLKNVFFFLRSNNSTIFKHQ